MSEILRIDQRLSWLISWFKKVSQNFLLSCQRLIASFFSTAFFDSTYSYNNTIQIPVNVSAHVVQAKFRHYDSYEAYFKPNVLQKFLHAIYMT